MKAFCKTLAPFLCILCICRTGFANVADVGRVCLWLLRL